MPFQRRWDEELRTYVIDRDLTGPPKPKPTKGTVQADDGTIVGDASNLVIPPATPIKVTIPGILERVVDSRGRMTPRWWRFFEELYRRTGAIKDNVNTTDRILGKSTSASSSTAAISLASTAPTLLINYIKSPGTASLALTGIAPTITVA